MSKAYLLLENGMVFEGEGFGAAGDARGRAGVHHGHDRLRREPDGPELSPGQLHHASPSRMLGNYGIAMHGL